MERTRGFLLIVSVLLFTPICSAAADTEASFQNPESQSHKRITIEPASNPENEKDTALAASNTPSGPRVYYFYEPFPLETGVSFLQMGASVSLLPYPDAEQEIPIPGIDVQYKLGVMDKVSFVGSFSTSFVSYLLHTGFQWNTNVERFSIGIAGHVGGVYGWINQFNLFDNVKAYGLFCMPILRLGYRFDDFSFSSSFVITYTFKSTSYVNKKEASIGPQKTINDYYCTLVVEQPFLRNLRVSIGFSLGYARTPYQSWMLYNTIDEWSFVPEFFFAVQL